MKIATIHAATWLKSNRLDARYFLSPGVAAEDRISEAEVHGLNRTPLSALATPWMPGRLKSRPAVPGEKAIPYLRPYDALDYLPVAADRLSVSRTENVDSYRLKKGMLLQTRSGRNLGPAVYVDAYLERFIISDDMIRIEIADETERLCLLAFLKSATGQQLLKRDKTGSVIDHLAPQQIGELRVPRFGDKACKAIADLMRRGIEHREQARLDLDTMLREYERNLPAPRRKHPMKEGWTQRAATLGSRIDAQFYDPYVAKLRAQLTKGGGVRVDTVARVMKPPSRYKTRYVEREYGRPLLSGGQLHEAAPVNLRYMAPAAFLRVKDYELRAGWVVYQADGRAEEGLGLPALVTSDRDDWLASGHVGRVIANNPKDAGWLWLALRTRQGQVQIKSMASGSVVDSTFENDMASVILPPKLGADFSKVVPAWERFVKAARAETDALAIVEAEIERAANPKNSLPTIGK